MPEAPARAPLDPTALLGRTRRYTNAARLLLLALCGLGLALRVSHLSAEGFGDDEVHKWLAANRYLHGDFGGDDVEHPMLMKWLITLCLLIGGHLGWAPEAITRLPNAVAGGLSVLVIALLGRRLFGNTAGLFAAALGALSCTLIGYQRVAKEDTLLGLFLMLLCWCLAEAKAAADDAASSEAPARAGSAAGDATASNHLDPAGRRREQRRWELFAALSLAGMLASKYFAWHALLAPIFVLSVRGESAWRVPLRRWLQLAGIAFAAWLCVNWSPLLPSTWTYFKSYTSGQQTVHGSLFFMGRIFHNLVEYGWNGTPPWFYAVFTWVKLTPGTLLLALGGLALALSRRRPAHKLLFAWMGVWFAIHSLSGSKWGRFYVSVLPAFLLLAAHAAVALARWLALPKGADRAARAGPTPADELRAALPRRPRSLARYSAALALFALLAVGGEAQATWTHAPHERLYISPLGGGDAEVDWYFPHCDYFDAGFREAMAYLAAHAEPGAEVATEIDWPAALYAGWDGRPDLLQTLDRKRRADDPSAGPLRGEGAHGVCRSGRPCYVVVQTGRLYFLNQEAVENLARRTPWHVEEIRGREVVKIYKMGPDESPFPSENPLPPLAKP